MQKVLASTFGLPHRRGRIFIILLRHAVFPESATVAVANAIASFERNCLRPSPLNTLLSAYGVDIVVEGKRRGVDPPCKALQGLADCP